MDSKFMILDISKKTNRVRTAALKKFLFHFCSDCSINVFIEDQKHSIITTSSNKIQTMFLQSTKKRWIFGFDAVRNKHV